MPRKSKVQEEEIMVIPEPKQLVLPTMEESAAGVPGPAPGLGSEDADLVALGIALDTLTYKLEKLVEQVERLAASHTAFHPSYGMQNCKHCLTIIAKANQLICHRCGKDWRA